MPTRGKRVALLLALCLGGAPFLAWGASEAAPTTKPAQLTGKVVAIADLVAKTGSKLDADAVPHWLALTTEDGKVYPLVKDGGGRLFFKDKRLLGRQVRITGRFLPGSQLLRVLVVHTLIKGELFEVYYWCDICSIRRGEKMQCECCGGPMEIREEPVKK